MRRRRQWPDRDARPFRRRQRRRSRAMYPPMPTDVGDECDGDEADDERTSAERDERQWNPRHGPGRRHDTDVDERLDRDHRRAADRQKETESIGCRKCDSDRAVSQRDEERNNRKGAEKAQLLSKHRENEIRVLFGQIEEFRARRTEADAEESAAPEREQRLNDVKARVERVFPRIEKREDARAPVWAREDRERSERHHRQDDR